jgi:hypothetical protein
MRGAFLCSVEIAASRFALLAIELSTNHRSVKMEWMKYGIIKGYKAEQFRQVTGVMPNTFNAMVR